MLQIAGYDKLGKETHEGVRYAWKTEYNKKYIESASFVNKTKGVSADICGYTTSVSSGCILKAIRKQCLFCRTGNLLPFGGLLTYRDIAKQNVFMVLADLYCSEHPELAHKKREFAYMGQGEPGYSYSQVRMAIELTNTIMRHLKQNVYRHIFATCGVPESIFCYKKDAKDYYTEKVTLHFSLHATELRDTIMPIDYIYPFRDSIDAMSDIVEITGEKPCIGILLFNHFRPKNSNAEYSNSIEVIKNIISVLDPKRFRLSFCEYNSSDEIGSSMIFPPEEAQYILDAAVASGFEAKLFYSFGHEKKSACGMLAGKEPEFVISKKWRELNEYADELIMRFSE